MNSPVNGLGNVTAADLISRAAPSPPPAHSGFEAVISDRGVDVAAATARPPESTRIASSSAVETVPESSSVASTATPAPSTSAVSGQSTEAGSLNAVAVSDEVIEQSPAGTYNARGRLALPTQEAPRSQLLDIIG